MNNYYKQAQAFLQKTGSTVTFTYLKTDCPDWDKKHKHDIYAFTLKRGSREYSATFTTSQKDTEEKAIAFLRINKKKLYPLKFNNGDYLTVEKEKFYNLTENKPHAYDLLAGLQKYDIGSFDDFCNDFGYNELPLAKYPEIMAIYEAVQKEYNALLSLYNDGELAELAEIQ